MIANVLGICNVVDSSKNDNLLGCVQILMEKIMGLITSVEKQPLTKGKI